MNNGAVPPLNEGGTPTILYDCSQIAHSGLSHGLHCASLGAISIWMCFSPLHFLYIKSRFWNICFVSEGKTEKLFLKSTPTVKSGDISSVLVWPLNCERAESVFLENCISVYWTLDWLHEKNSSSWRSDRSKAK